MPERKQLENRLHFDVVPTDRTRDDETERVLALGATIIGDAMASIPQLTSRDRRALRTHVLEQLIRLDEQIASLSRSFDDIVDGAELTSTDDEHDPEGSTIAFERALVSSLLRQAVDDRAAMRIADERIGQTGYGVCENCTGFIGVERLLALPSAQRCITCARTM